MNSRAVAPRRLDHRAQISHRLTRNTHAHAHAHPPGTGAPTSNAVPNATQALGPSDIESLRSATHRFKHARAQKRYHQKKGVKNGTYRGVRGRPRSSSNHIRTLRGDDNAPVHTRTVAKE